MFHDKTLDRLNRMLDDGIAGRFSESDYDESKISRLESKWKHYLVQSSLSKKNLDRERENIKGMISDISHQTKTPMTNIRMYSELLKEHLQEKSDRTGAGLAEEIIRQTEKLDFLIQCLTKLSRLESGTVNVFPKNNSLFDLLNDAVGSIKPKSENKKISVTFSVEKSVSACFDMKWTKEALGNILDNAVKYSPEGSRITVEVKNYEMYAEVIVRDEGRGIPEDEIPKIFGRFYRGTDVRDEEGVGIGLFLAREIIKRENGYIKVNSVVGEGSAFSVFLKK